MSLRGHAKSETGLPVPLLLRACPMFAAIRLNLENLPELPANAPQIAGVGIILAGLAWMARNEGWKLPNISLPKFSGSPNSDRMPPKGFGNHVKLIQEASPQASAEIREEYFHDELTEAQTLRREVERLSGPATSEVLESVISQRLAKEIIDAHQTTVEELAS